MSRCTYLSTVLSTSMPDHYGYSRIRFLECAYLFPRYNKTNVSNANSASAALNKWLKPMLPENCVVHSFRHSFRDRLRAVECPSDIIDAIGGWKTFGVGQGYGSGYGLDVKYKWMNIIALDNPILQSQ